MPGHKPWLPALATDDKSSRLYMKPPAFGYEAPTSIEQATALLSMHDGDARIIAGGQSLVPMLNFRLLVPSVLVDINRIAGLDEIRDDGKGGLTIGALVRHFQLEASELVAARFPILTEAVRHIAHLAIRNRGTIGGSLSHADPAAELPMMVQLLNGALTIAGPDGTRTVAARDFFDGALTTVLDDAEIVTEIALPALPAGAGWGFKEVARRAGDFAMAAAAVTLTQKDTLIEEARVAVMGVHDQAIRVPGAEAMLQGAVADNGTITAAIAAVREAVDPDDDLHATAEFRRHLIGVLVGRAIHDAWHRAAVAHT
ncbi:MAG: xanthine dehydrogenase family protein subunit M [Rhodospirillaceae bacterium]|nr:xanthine dehydrogenase family protein subunit M [Rhodospirillaceae bacterium]